MLKKIRAGGVALRLGEAGQLQTSGKMTELQRKYLKDHTQELLTLLWTEDGQSECTGCRMAFDCHQEGEYVINGILCGLCVVAMRSALAGQPAPPWKAETWGAA